MTIDLDPHAFGMALLPWTTLMTLLGVVVAFAYVMRAAVSLGASPRDVYGIGMRAAFWAILGARLFHVADNVGFYREVPLQVLYLWNGGMSLWGAVLVGLAGALWHAKRHGVGSSVFAERIAVAGLMAITVGRLGDFLAGERPGESTSLPWAVTYAHRGSESFGLGATHPVALYEALAVVVLLVVVVRWRRADALAVALAGYAVARFLIGFATVSSTYLGLVFAQWIALAVGAGLVYWYVRRRYPSAS